MVSEHFLLAQNRENYGEMDRECHSITLSSAGNRDMPTKRNKKLFKHVLSLCLSQIRSLTYQPAKSTVISIGKKHLLYE